MKVLIGSFQCEANTFCSGRAGIEDFEVYRRDEVLEKIAAVSIFREAGADIVPLIFASALPSGMVKRDAFEFFKEEFIKLIKPHKDADGIYLYLHGSMYVEGMGSGEEGLVLAIRQIVGDEIPISVALDFHGNLSDQFIQNVNAIQGFRTAPHTDHDDTEYRAAQSLLKCIHYGVHPIPQRVRIPFLGGDASVTSRHPFPAVTERLKTLDREEQVISCAFFNGQPWYDSEYTGNCAVVSGIGNAAKEEALLLAKIFWEGRASLTLDGAMMPEEAVKKSLDNRAGILFVTDSGDNTTAGANGEGTLLLQKYLGEEAEHVLICGILDEVITNRLLERKEGEETDITLCKGRFEKQEIETSMKVRLKSKGVVYGWAGDEIGKGVRVSCKNIDIVLTNARAAFTTPEHFKRMGIEPLEYKVIVLKMGYLFPKLREISSKNIFALTPGVSTNDFKQLKFHKLKHKMYPVDQNITWEEIEKEV